MKIIEGFQPAKSALSRQAVAEFYSVSPTLRQRLKELFGTDDPEQAVGQIINEVRTRGDAALFDYTSKIDRVELTALEVNKQQRKIVINKILTRIMGLLLLGIIIGFLTYLGVSYLKDKLPEKISDNINNITIPTPENITEINITNQTTPIVNITNQTNQTFIPRRRGGGGGGGGGPSCTPNCDGKQCGDDGCGGSCGNCPDGQTCENGICIPISCTNDTGCDAEGIFCQNNAPYNCTPGGDGCLDRINLTECGEGFECVNNTGCVLIADCTHDDNCSFLNNACKNRSM